MNQQVGKVRLGLLLGGIYLALSLLSTIMQVVGSAMHMPVLTTIALGIGLLASPLALASGILMFFARPETSAKLPLVFAALAGLFILAVR